MQMIPKLQSFDPEKLCKEEDSWGEGTRIFMGRGNRVDFIVDWGMGDGSEKDHV